MCDKRTSNKYELDCTKPFHNAMDPDIVLLCRNLTSIFGPKRQEVQDGGKNLNN
jgi:hypothetical protein